MEPSGLRIVIPLAAVVIGCVSLSSIHDALAQNPSPSRPPRFAVDIQRVPGKEEFDTPEHRIRVTYDGCWTNEYDEAEDDFVWHYSSDSTDCLDAELKITRAGRVVKRVRGEDALLGATLSWSCGGKFRHGVYRWRLSYFNASYTVNGNAFEATERGRFSIPRCRWPRGRRVDRGTAAQAANSANQDAYKSEFISSVRCSATGPVRNGKSSRWLCATTHNNTYRECTDRDRFFFIGRDRWNRHVRSWTVLSTKKSCRFF